MEVNLVSHTKIDQKYLEKLMAQMDNDNADFDFIKNVQDLEGLIAYIARVSSKNKKNPNYAGLIRYCISHGHWSILEMGNVSFEVQTSRMIAPQILRHRSFNFQEFSQRYQSLDESGIEICVARRQDKKNRQNSIDDVPDAVQAEWKQRQLDNWKVCFENYKWALDNDIAKECARAVLPLQSTTTLYMNGTLRSWLHYVNLRCDPSTQKEHRDIAEAIKSSLINKFPIVAEAAGWIT
jgi:thymidylate synthase (FAD)